MKVWRVFNGLMGNSALHCVVVAADEAEAVELGRAAFAGEWERMRSEWSGKHSPYNDEKRERRYSSKIEAEELLDATVPGASEVYDL